MTCHCNVLLLLALQMMCGATFCRGQAISGGPTGWFQSCLGTQKQSPGHACCSSRCCNNGILMTLFHRQAQHPSSHPPLLLYCRIGCLLLQQHFQQQALEYPVQTPPPTSFPPTFSPLGPFSPSLLNTICSWRLYAIST